MLYTNINDSFGDPISFHSLHDMGQAIQECGYNLPSDGLQEGRDYIVSKEKPYNGWSNWSTWNTYNILTSYPNAYEHVMQIAGQSKDIHYFALTLKNDMEDFLFGDMESFFEDNNFFEQIFNTIADTYLMRVNWLELAQSFWEDREDD